MITHQSIAEKTRTDEFALDFFKLVLYLTFFCVLCIFYGMPIHIIRDVALTVRSFYKRVRDFVQYKQATRDMNARYPDATAEEISREDVCIICRENMTVWQGTTSHGDSETPRVEHRPIDERQRAKRLPCGHLLHFACLRSWLERQQICPTCRTPVIRNNTDQPSSTLAAGPNEQGAPAAVNPPPGGPHVYTLGPFRLVLGARQVNNAPLPNPAAAGTLGNPLQPVLQHRNAVTLSSAGVQAQLHQIEQYISREISNFNHLSSQLQVIRALQAELARLRASQGLPGAFVPAPDYQLRQVPGQPAQQILQAYRQVPLSHGGRDYPAGVTIPDGWTLHALERVAGSAVPGITANNNNEPTPREQQSVTGGPQVQPIPEFGPGVGGSSSSAQPPNSEGGPGAFEVRGYDHTVPEPDMSSLDGTLTALPQWVSPNVNADARRGPSAEERLEVESSRQKGKGKSVTVEDDVEDAN